jgi:hypothetical protein
MAGALIVTAELGSHDFAWLDQLRRAHYPPERNQVAVHLTIFHSLPPSARGELQSRLTKFAAAAPPKASIEGLMDLGGGVAFRVVSAELDRIREDLLNELHGLLGAQDFRGWRPHITIQNKVPPRESRMLAGALERGFSPRALSIAGLGIHCYMGGPWERVAIYPFRGT